MSNIALCKNCKYFCESEEICELVRGCIGQNTKSYNWCKDFESKEVKS